MDKFDWSAFYMGISTAFVLALLVMIVGMFLAKSAIDKGVEAGEITINRNEHVIETKPTVEEESNG